MSTNAVANTPESQQVSTQVDFGNGRYSPLMQEVFDDAQVVYHLNPAIAEKLARKIASEIGAIMQDRPVEIKLSKVSKDGKMTIAEAAKVKGVTQTYPLLALRGLHYAAEAGKNGFSWRDTSWKVSKTLADWFATL